MNINLNPKKMTTTEKAFLKLQNENKTETEHQNTFHVKTSRQNCYCVGSIFFCNSFDKEHFYTKLYNNQKTLKNQVTIKRRNLFTGKEFVLFKIKINK